MIKITTALLILLCILTACTPTSLLIVDTRTNVTTQTPPSVVATPTYCTPTVDDGVSPTYKSNAPVRAVVGHGHILRGVVRSSRDCAPIANAKIELWPQYTGASHPDSARATLFTDRAGRYHFECDLPEHIHMRVSAVGYHTIGNNSYHPNGKAEGTFDLVLVPDVP